MVRSIRTQLFRAPWPFVKTGKMGHRKIGPVMMEKLVWPSPNREFPELHPHLFNLYPEKLKGYLHEHPTSYKDQVNGEEIEYKEMIPEMIVPDLTGFELKPYVSYRTNVDIEIKQEAYEAAVRKHGSEEEADKHTDAWMRWPPPPMTARTLFDLHYKEKIRAEYKISMAKK